MTVGIVVFLAVLALVALAVVGIIARSDDDDIDLKEYADWERLR